MSPIEFETLRNINDPNPSVIITKYEQTLTYRPSVDLMRDFIRGGFNPNSRATIFEVGNVKEYSKELHHKLQDISHIITLMNDLNAQEELLFYKGNFGSIDTLDSEVEKIKRSLDRNK